MKIAIKAHINATGVTEIYPDGTVRGYAFGSVRSKQPRHVSRTSAVHSDPECAPVVLPPARPLGLSVLPATFRL